MKLAAFKLLSAALTFGVAFGGVLLPHALSGSDLVLSLARMLSVGVMLGGGLLLLVLLAHEALGMRRTRQPIGMATSGALARSADEGASGSTIRRA